MIKVSEGFGHGIGMSQRLRWGDMMWERKKEEKKRGRIASHNFGMILEFSKYE